MLCITKPLRILKKSLVNFYGFKEITCTCCRSWTYYLFVVLIMFMRLNSNLIKMSGEHILIQVKETLQMRAGNIKSVFLNVPSGGRQS